jgi:hypothetical protein
VLGKPPGDKPVQDQRLRASHRRRAEVQILGREGRPEPPQAAGPTKQTIRPQRTPLGQLLGNPGQSVGGVGIAPEDPSGPPGTIAHRAIAPRHHHHKGLPGGSWRRRGARTRGSDRPSVKPDRQRLERISAFREGRQPALTRPADPLLPGLTTSSPVPNHTDHRRWHIGCDHRCLAVNYSRPPRCHGHTFPDRPCSYRHIGKEASSPEILHAMPSAPVHEASRCLARHHNVRLGCWQIAGSLGLNAQHRPLGRGRAAPPVVLWGRLARMLRPGSRPPQRQGGPGADVETLSSPMAAWGTGGGLW